MYPESPSLWSQLARQCAEAGRRLPPLPAFRAAVNGDRDRSFAELGYTFWNGELLDRMAARLKVIEDDLTPEACPFRWVELAAGTGRWAAELARRGLAVVATDNFAQESPAGRQRTIGYGDWVGRMSAREAVEKLRPHGALCAWPPLGSCLVLDLLQREWPGSDCLQVVVCVGEPGGATEAPAHPSLLPAGWELRHWPECERYLVGFNDPPQGPGWRSNSQLLIFFRTQQRSHTGNLTGAAEPEG